MLSSYSYGHSYMGALAPTRKDSVMDKSSQPAVTDQAAPSVIVSEYDAQSYQLYILDLVRRSCQCVTVVVIHGWTRWYNANLIVACCYSRTLLV